MMPLAPGLFSTITGWPACASTYWPKVRAVISPEPPGPKGTTILTGFEGQTWRADCAAASELAKVTEVTAATAHPRNALSRIETLFLHDRRGRGRAEEAHQRFRRFGLLR